MYLCQALLDAEGRRFPMTGCLPFTTTMTDRLRSLGYREVTLRQDTVIGEKGSALRGHEFHYSSLVQPLQTSVNQVYQISKRSGRNLKDEGFQRQNTLGSYIHLHFGSCIQAAQRFVKVCRGYAEKRGAL